MNPSLLATKLFIPPLRPKAIPRPGLIGRLEEGLAAGRKLTLVSASAGFGKTTLVAEWVSGFARTAPERQVAWLSLDRDDDEPSRFLAYLIAALRTVADIGSGLESALQSPQPPSAESVLVRLLNEISLIPHLIILVLDDCHLLASRELGETLAFLLDQLPPRMHLVITAREDPPLPLARLRARDQLTELRAADLRFSRDDAAAFLNRTMALELSSDAIATLESRTEGWIAGLQLAALSMHDEKDSAGFIRSFSASHRFVLDYLVEEVLHQQSAAIQSFLLCSSILDQLSGPLCDAVLQLDSSQATLEYLDRANLFIIPLDNERRWYRYHHLFAELLRLRLGNDTASLHHRASLWYEGKGQDFAAFRHAAAANDLPRAEALIDGGRIPLHSRSVVAVVLDWLDSLPAAARDARPSLWIKSATMALVIGRSAGVDEKLQAAEKALGDCGDDPAKRDLSGIIASARATLALTRYQPETIVTQAGRALEYLSADNLPFRFTANWTLGVACQLGGQRPAALRAFSEAAAISRLSGDAFSSILATTGLAELQELGTKLHLAAETYRSCLELFGEHPLPAACEVHLGLARIHYQWNDLDAAQFHAQRSLELARHYDRSIDRFILSELFLARLALARNKPDEAMSLLANTEQSIRQARFGHRLAEWAEVKVLALLRINKSALAAAQAQATPPASTGRARVRLAQGDARGALELLAPLRRQSEDNDWPDELLRVLALEALALQAAGEAEPAALTLVRLLELAATDSHIRILADEGPLMACLLDQLVNPAIPQDYLLRLHSAFRSGAPPGPLAAVQAEALAPRELEMLRLIAQGLSNQAIAERLYISLSTVKWHNQRLFDKLRVERRTEAVARGREWGLLPR